MDLAIFQSVLAKIQCLDRDYFFEECLSGKYEPYTSDYVIKEIDDEKTRYHIGRNSHYPL